MPIRPETSADHAQVAAVVAEAFRLAEHSAPPAPGTDVPGEVTLLERLRADLGWIPELALVAETDGVAIGQVTCTRADVAGRPALGLGPLAVRPDHQGRGVGAALMQAVLAAAEQRDEQLVCLLGDPGFYSRFGFVPASSLGVTAPDEAWGDYFQARALTGYDGFRGVFRYAAPFEEL